MKIFLRAVTLLAVLACLPQVLAHAFLDRAAPPVGSAVHESPSEVRLHFSEALEPAFCMVRVLDRNGTQVDRMDKQIDPSATLLKVTVPRLAPGIYRVVWRVVSADTHVSDGDYTFEIAP
jgi:hypothetical protein